MLLSLKKILLPQFFFLLATPLTHANEFYEKWDSYLTNFKISDEEVNKANEMAKICKNKIPIFKKKIMSLILNEKILYFENDMDDLLDCNLGVMDRSSIGKIDFENIKTVCLIDDEKIDFFLWNQIIL